MLSTQKKSQTPMGRSIALVLFHPLGRTGAASELRSHGHGGYSPHHHSSSYKRLCHHIRRQRYYLQTRKPYA
ncbi:hypothetical protein CMEL01_10794 [Colletotrichum melonis]|uniref:Uncharacterized protein n=1 Tax=Colletotrichum melonis TaxID=1209925 RepID=A0AAI9XWP7_9PEZI|nr:hypothetical protein CMEL01_10794 [Colletotrichum melonis]